MVLREVFGPKWEEVTVVLRRLHNLYLLLCITVLVEWSRRKCVVHVLNVLFAYHILLGKDLWEELTGESWVWMVELFWNWS